MDFSVCNLGPHPLSTVLMNRGDNDPLCARGELLRVGLVRAVGGLSSLLSELSRISFEVDGTVSIDWMLKRVQFFNYELEAQSKTWGPISRLPDRVELLNSFVFREKGFRVEASPTKIGPHEWLLQNLLSLRTGCAETVAALYALFAESKDIPVDFIEIRDASDQSQWLLRCMDDGGQAHYLDVQKSCSLLKYEEILELLHLSKDQTQEVVTALEPKSIDQLLICYIKKLKRRMPVESYGEQLLKLQNLLVAWKPSEIGFLAERAYVYEQLGQSNSALADLKRYFSFQDRLLAPPEIVRLYDELSARLNADSVHP